jgi:hypothetical protein
VIVRARDQRGAAAARVNQYRAQAVARQVNGRRKAGGTSADNETIGVHFLSPGETSFN